MQALHLVYQHWFITCIVLVVGGGVLARIILAIRGVVESSNK